MVVTKARQLTPLVPVVVSFSEPFRNLFLLICEQLEIVENDYFHHHELRRGKEERPVEDLTDP